jgi:hypothetical protein
MLSPDEARARTEPIAEDLRFQRADWLAERVAWTMLAALIAAALFGIFSNGSLSKAVVSDPGAKLAVHFDRYMRRGAVAQFSLKVAADRASSGLLLDRAFLNAFRIDAVKPHPRSERSHAGGLLLSFDAASGKALNIELVARPYAPGQVATTMAIEGGHPANLQILVYP